MKPPPFSYVAPTTKRAALEALAAGGEDAKVLAGGQSLMPMMNFRLVRPSVLVDINRVAGLSGIVAEATGLTVGALTRHAETASSPLLAQHFPMLTEAMTHIAHFTVRNRGTFGGSIAHADPAGELPMMALLLEAAVIAESTSATRTIEIGGFFRSALTTQLEAGELLTSVRLPFLADGTGWGFEEFARRHGDYALACVAILLRRRGKDAVGVRIAAMGVGDTPVRLTRAEAALEDKPFNVEAVDAMVAALRDSISPNADLNGSSDYRRHLAGNLARRAAFAAWERAT